MGNEEARTVIYPQTITRFLTIHAVLSFSIEPCKSSIYPFQELKRPLQFLGLYDTTLCNVTHIPAYKVPRLVSVSPSNRPDAHLRFC